VPVVVRSYGCVFQGFEKRSRDVFALRVVELAMESALLYRFYPVRQ
jgi:hypothetical protein